MENELNIYFSNEDVKNGQTTHEKMLIREVQLKLH
jgi:hypothetical protein